jgi:hypothetical protein
VSHLKVVSPPDQALFDALVTALPMNSALRRLDLNRQYSDADQDLSPVILAWGKNTELKTVSLDWFGSIDKLLCTAMQNGLGMNGILESLELNRVHLADDNSDLWCRALSFLRTNKTLKSLMVTLDSDVADPRVAAVRTGIAAILSRPAGFTPSRGIYRSHHRTPTQHDAQVNPFSTRWKTSSIDGRRDKQMAVHLEKNYALERPSHLATE